MSERSDCQVEEEKKVLIRGRHLSEYSSQLPPDPPHHTHHGPDTISTSQGRLHPQPEGDPVQAGPQAAGQVHQQEEEEVRWSGVRSYTSSHY